MQFLGFVTKVDDIVTFKEIRELSEEEYLNYNDSLNDIYKIDDEIALFHMIYINYLDFQQYLELIIKNFNESLLSESKIKSIMNNLNCKLNNFLSSIKLFLDHFQKILKDDYGKDSDEFKLFKRETSKLFDNYFSYRFLYHLRNYVQHRHLGISIFEIYRDTNEINLSVALNRDELLSCYSWQSLVNQDLKNQPKVIEIFPLMSEMLFNLKNLTKILVKDELNKNWGSVNFINNLKSEVDYLNLPIIFDCSQDKLNYSEFPLELLNFIDFVLS